MVIITIRTTRETGISFKSMKRATQNLGKLKKSQSPNSRPDRISFPFGLGANLVRGEAYVLRKINEI